MVMATATEFTGSRSVQWRSRMVSASICARLVTSMVSLLTSSPWILWESCNGCDNGVSRFFMVEGVVPCPIRR